LTCTALPASVGDRGEISFALKNLGSSALNLQATVLLPREFRSPRIKETFVLEPGTTETLSLEVFNASALQGANYPVYGIFHYETREMHQTLVVPSTLKVSEKGNWFARTRWYWLLGGLLGIGIGMGRWFEKR
jgi:hypothetical protein